MPGVIQNSSKSVMWSPTPLDKKFPNSGWSEDAKIRIFDTGKTDQETILKDNELSYVDVVVYVLYWDNVDNMTYLKDIREDVLYSIPSGAKAKGYTLAFKLNMNHKDK
jgi:hypothetical protein